MLTSFEVYGLNF